MECNKDEALRAKEIAEKKFLANDIAAARKFALKAQNLFPSLDGINQIIATLDVYLSSDARSDREKDWYAILSLNPSADDETVKKQYRKLALQLHPDKNKSIGAEGAFQLISEAWSVLSDRSRRMLYDQKRLGRAFQQKTTTSVPNTANGVSTKCNNAASKAQRQKSNSVTPPTSCNLKPPSPASKPGTFWTSCNQCKMQYEYLRAYLNLNLLCPNCKKPFVASENVVPSKGLNYSAAQFPPQKLHPNSSINMTTKKSHGTSTFHNVGVQPGIGPNLNSSSNFQWGPFSRTAEAANLSAPSSAAAQAASVVRDTYEKVKSEREQAQAAARREEALRRSGLKRNFGSGNINTGFGANEHYKNSKRRRGIVDDPRTNYGGDKGNVGMYTTNISSSTVNSRQFNIRKGFPQAHVLTVLMGKSKDEIHKKVESWIAERTAKAAEKEKAKKKQKPMESVKEKLKESNAGIAANQDRIDELNCKSKQAPPVIDSANTENVDSDKEVTEPMNIDVPDADFHDFDKDRTETSFKGDEIWATYDDEDGMPRYYALIQKVISCKPFKVRMSFLASSKSTSEFGPLNWVSSGFAKTSGDFRVVKYDVYDTLNVFSHKVKWEKGLRGVIKIVPAKGEVWALYRNWSPDWNEHTPDDVMYKYDMVEVLEDYNGEQGVSVAPLVKIAGFKTVFHRHLDPKKVKRIPREEMFRFSHQVPSYVLTGEEGPNAPKGCLELDPAATPLELLRVITEAKDDEVIQVSDIQKKQMAS